MPVISNVALTNTFDEWRVITNQTVVALNDILGDGTPGSVASVRRHVTGLQITANSIILTGDASQNVGGILNFTTNIANLAFGQANTARNIANTSNGILSLSFSIANLAFNQANAGLYVSNTQNTNITAAFLKANQTGGAVDTANSNITAAFLKANQVGAAVTTSNSIITLAFNQANSALYVANGTNGALTTANSNITAAFLKANQVGGAVSSVNVTAQYAADLANTISAGGGTAIAVLAFNQSNVAYTQSNNAVLKTGNTMTGNLVFTGANIAFKQTTANLGIYWDGTSFIHVRETNVLVLGTNSSERMRITSAGIVGVGTQSPDSTSGMKLDVNGTLKASLLAAGASPIASTTSVAQLTGDLSVFGSGLGIFGNLYYSGGWFYGGNGYGWGFEENGSGKLQMLSAGNNGSGIGAAASPSTSGLFTFDLGNNLIGAGASSPLTKFQVSAAGTKNVPTLGSAASAPLLITNNDPTYGLVIGTNATDGRVWIQSQRTDATATAYNITLNEAGGNVGVGTTTPAATFDVVGTFSVARASVLNQSFTQTTTTWNTSLGQIATLTLGASMASFTASNLKVGTYILHVVQGGSGSYTIGWDTNVFKWTQGVAPTLSTTVGRRDVFSFVSDGTYLYGAMIPDVR